MQIPLKNTILKIALRNLFSQKCIKNLLRYNLNYYLRKWVFTLKNNSITLMPAYPINEVWIPMLCDVDYVDMCVNNMCVEVVKY